jgi:hypothetical protein
MVIVVILVAVIALASIAAAYIAFKPASTSLGSKTSPTPTPATSPTSTPKSSPAPTATPHATSAPTAAPTTQPTTAPTSAPTASPTPAPTATPAPTPTPNPNSHTVDYTAMMTGSESDYWDESVSSGYTITLEDSMTVSSGDQYLLISALSGSSTVWSVLFLTSSTYQIGGNSTVFNCVNGLVYVVVNSNSITFIGTTSNTVSATFTSLTQIRTANGDGDFNGGNLEITLTTS